MTSISEASALLDDEIQKARALASSGKYDEAEAAYTALLQRHPDEPRVLATLGTLLFWKGQLREAKALVEKSLHISPNQPKTLLNLSGILISLGELTGALHAADQSISQEPSISDAWNNRGIALNAFGRREEALESLNHALNLNPDNIEALYNKGTVLQAMGLTESALECYRAVLVKNPTHGGACLNAAGLLAAIGERDEAIIQLSDVISALPDFDNARLLRSQLLFQQGRFREALDDSSSILSRNPKSHPALFQHGATLLESGDANTALTYLNQAIVIAPTDIPTLLAIGVSFYDLKEYGSALKSFDAALALDSQLPETHNNKGLVLHDMQQPDAAITCFKRALELRPIFPDAMYNYANALREQGAFEDALALYEQLLAVAPEHLNNYKGMLNKGVTHERLKHYNEALVAYEQAIVLAPENVEAHVNAANILIRLNRIDKAIGHTNKALKLNPRNTDALYQRASELLRQGLKEYAKTTIEAALEIEPRHTLANHLMGQLLDDQERYPEALKYFEAAYAEKPQQEFLAGRITQLRSLMCDWNNYQESVDTILSLIEQGKPASHPFELHSKADAPIHHRKCAEIYFDTLLRTGPPTPVPHHPDNRRIHVAYFSTDIGNHPVSNLMAGVFESHNRDNFEITLVALENHTGEVRNRIFSACERTINAEFMTDEEVAELSRELQIDIAVDLNGYTSKNRTGIFTKRVAPLQLNYIGYLGTMGSDCHDYIIGDPIISPISHESYFTEKILNLPFYQANDDKIAIPKTTRTRTDFGLPENAFVFCSFNSNYKITPTMFSAWMRILGQVPDSVLWLHCKREDAIRNLRSSAETHGVSGERLIIAPGVSYREHLARHRLADLFLDTFPYNAGATASNALYCGLPLITYCGQSFCSRYGASLLTALDLPELITESEDEYIAKSISIATSSSTLAELKEKLARNLKASPLFNTRTFTRNLECAYETILARHRQGLPPEHIEVAQPGEK